MNLLEMIYISHLHPWRSLMLYHQCIQLLLDDHRWLSQSHSKFHLKSFRRVQSFLIEVEDQPCFISHQDVLQNVCAWVKRHLTLYWEESFFSQLMVICYQEKWIQIANVKIMNGTWNCFSIFRVFIWSPIYSHYHNWFSLVFWLFETSLELLKVSYSLHDSEIVIRTWPRMFCTLNTYINWFWICRSIWRETCMSPMISGTSLFCIAVMKSWLGSLTLYSTCITNGARLFAAVSPIGTLALLSWE